MTEHPIEYGIPIPGRRKPGKSKYGFGDMKVGGSRFTPSKPAAVREAVRQWRRLNGGVWTTRAEGTGTRYWRVG